MDLKIHQVKCAGDLKNERLVLIANGSVDSYDYGVGMTEGDEDSFYPILSFFFMLPSVKMAKGDMLSIYTCGGVQDSYLLASSSKVNRIFMGFEAPLWSLKKKALLLNWSGFFVQDVNKIHHKG